MRKNFQFKQFSITDENSAMKVGTDAVLLGTWTDLSNSKKILDVGTGSGVIALMLAQRSEARITAIDIHSESIRDASENIRNSPWHNRLSVLHTSLQNYVKTSKTQFDLIISNPPFFSNSLKSESENNKLSKHDKELTHEELLSGASKLLDSKGRFCVILPASEAENFKVLALIENLYCSKELEIIPKNNKKPNRLILEFTFIRPKKKSKTDLCIRNSDDSYTEQYIDLTKEFYLNL